MHKPISYKKRLIIFFSFILVFVIGFPLLVFYSAGYSLDNPFGFSARGGIYVFTPEPDTSVFIGNEIKNVTGFFNKETLDDRLKPGPYLVLTANDLYWPWAKRVEVTKGEVEALFPLMVLKEIPATEIFKTDSDYADVTKLFSRTATSTALAARKATTTTALPIELERRRVSIWLDGDMLFSRWNGDPGAAPAYFCLRGGCINPVQVFRAYVPVRSFDFYPLRDDAVLLALDNAIYAVEIDSRLYQNFYPIYRGVAPDFRVDGGDIFVKDAGKFYQLDLER
jgi:hypothetical protein